MTQSFLVVGGGSAGFLSALILKKVFPDLPVTVVRSKEPGFFRTRSGAQLTSYVAKDR